MKEKNKDSIKEEPKTIKEEILEDIVDEGLEELIEEKKEPSLEEQLLLMNDKFIRLSAEFMNFKKRTEKEKNDIYKYANDKLIIELLPVIDNIDRALDSIEGAKNHKSIIDGVNMIKNNFDEFLKKNGVKKIDAIGEPFDPIFHHAVMTEENDDYDDETIIDEFQVGYKLNEKVIRPTMVKVSKKSE